MKSLYVNGYPKYCGYCGANLAPCRNVWRDKALRADYCTRTCLEGARLTQASRLQSPLYIGIAALIAVFLVSFATSHKARAQEQPDEKIRPYKNPDLTGQDGHICYSISSGILCAVPPTGSL